MNMKMTRLVMAAAAAMLIFAPTAYSADEEPEMKAGPSEAEKAKARKAKKPMYTKAAEALKAAEQCDQPILAFLLKDDPISKVIEQKLITFKPFKEDIAKKYLVVLKLKVKVDPKATKDKKIDLKPLKPAELKIFENFGLDDELVRTAKAKNDGKEPTYDLAANYPAVVMIAPNGVKKLFRMPRYDTEGGLGVWMSTAIDQIRTAGVEIEMTPRLEKIVENPTEPKKWK